MKYKAIICDLDGTLLSTNHKISPYTIDVIKKITSMGVKFYIATGRHHIDAFSFKNMLGLDSFLISSNGAKVHDKNNQEIFSITIPKDITTEIINLTEFSDVHKSIYKDDQWYVEKPLDDSEDFHSESGFTYTLLSSISDMKGKNISKIFFISEDEEKIELLNKQLDEKIGDKISLTLSLSSCLEIMNKGVSKGEAIKKMLEIEDIPIEESIAFGDGLNDLEMLSVVGKGFLMGNCNPKLKIHLPNHEVILRNDEDGVAKKLEEIFLK